MIPAVVANASTVLPSLSPPAQGRPRGAYLFAALPFCLAAFRIAKNRRNMRLQSSPTCVAMPCTRSKLFKGVRISSHAPRLSCKTGVCVASQNARCAAAEQTQTVKRQSSTISIVPSQGMKTPKLDDGDIGFPPTNGGGGGGGGGGGSSSSGGFFLFGFLLFLSYLKDQEEEGSRKLQMEEL